MLALKAENISKQYRLGQVGTGTLSHDLNRLWAQIRGKEDPYLRIGETNDRTSKGESEYVWSLRDINFEVEQGDAVGIIGRNGAGKSTLLKLLSKVTKPTTGKIYSNGRIASLLEVGTGFHPEMTGRENIYLNGAILGMTRKEINRKFDEIVDFSGVERYIDTPVKRYSSGMYVRLAFAVAAHLESEILIVDEVLAVGDAEFQKKCLGKMGDVSKGEGRTVLFVSHNMAAVNNLCKSGILLDKGLLLKNGNIEEVSYAYKQLRIDTYEKYIAKKQKDLYVSVAEILGDSAEFYSNENISFHFKIENHLPKNSHFFILIRIMDGDEQPIFSAEQPIEDKNSFSITIPQNTLVKGNYSLSIYLYKPGSSPFDVVEKCCDFSVINNNDEFAHLENFNIGKVYSPTIWH
ncbi:ATP-binding cassette domain-containing protein [Candidatus Kaistella beijingensis]|uniref:ABC transporter ATP-binding protein n=1 Tax=Candidatus Kaistella beijingensis TaxID=2820270 RepID=UPI001CC3A53D|nr:polysaccharide ABC transporter ATP-binding protein [Candidatus Kaistella beijingensis]UBB89226.1 ATP-binding cassette domain-containing protein [Candidatus Kaistella beijingensis]